MVSVSVLGIGIERRIEIDQVNTLIGEILAQNGAAEARRTTQVVPVK